MTDNLSSCFLPSSPLFSSPLLLYLFPPLFSPLVSLPSSLLVSLLHSPLSHLLSPSPLFCQRLQRFDEAEALYERCVQLWRSLTHKGYGPHHPNTLIAIGNLGDPPLARRYMTTSPSDQPQHIHHHPNTLTPSLSLHHHCHRQPSLALRFSSEAFPCPALASRGSGDPSHHPWRLPPPDTQQVL